MSFITSGPLPTSWTNNCFSSGSLFAMLVWLFSFLSGILAAQHCLSFPRDICKQQDHFISISRLQPTVCSLCMAKRKVVANDGRILFNVKLEMLKSLLRARCSFCSPPRSSLCLRFRAGLHTRPGSGKKVCRCPATNGNHNWIICSTYHRNSTIFIP